MESHADAITYVADILAAARALDQPRAQALFRAAADVLGLDSTVDDVALPVMRVFNMLLSADQLEIAHEHLLTVTLTRWTAGAADTLPQPDRAGLVLLTTGPDDLHTLALDGLGLLLRRRGVPTCNLGASVPTPALLSTAESLRPAAVVVVSHTSSATRAAVHSVTAVHDAGHAVYYAGASFASQFIRRTTPGTPLDGTITETADQLATRHTHPSPRLTLAAHPPARRSAAQQDRYLGPSTGTTRHQPHD